MKYIMEKNGLFLSYIRRDGTHVVSEEMHNALLVTKETKKKLVENGSFELFLALKEEK